MEYREKFWARYVSVVQLLREPLNLAVTDHWSRPFEYWMRGWMPPAKDAAIVDIACGAGNMLRYFTRLGYTNVSGVDISPPQVELARAIHPQVEVADALEFLGSNRDRFDLILAFDVVEHLTKDELLVFTERALAALRPRTHHSPDAQRREPIRRRIPVRRFHPRTLLDAEEPWPGPGHRGIRRL